MANGQGTDFVVGSQTADRIEHPREDEIVDEVPLQADISFHRLSRPFSD
jgi:hypothetical protein